MDFTVELAKSFNLSPFTILDEEKDKVIMLINYFVEKSDTEEPASIPAKKTYDEPEKIKVTDATASGGWW